MTEGLNMSEGRQLKWVDHYVSCVIHKVVLECRTHGQIEAKV